MGKTDEGKKISTMDNLSLTIPANEFSRDLLQRFTGSAGESGTVIEEDGGIELNLGLSLGGRFGVEKLHRSSSIASCLPIVRDDDSSETAAPSPAPACTKVLARTSSLPLEAEEEWRKRKEWQTLRRLEAKRRRSEKQRNNSAVSSLAAVKPGGGTDVAMVKGKGRFVGSDGKHGFANPTPSSSFVLDIGNKTPTQGSRDEPSPASNLDATSKSTANTNRATGSKPESPSKRSIASKSNSLEDMPCVFTRGDGPNGKRVDGILYKYGKGQEVRIMCVCHGTFHSPGEFIAHAGGTDVNHPLKHIVVNRNASPLL